MIQLEKCSEYGKSGDLTGPDREHAEVSMLALHLLQSALVHVNTALPQIILTEPHWQARMTPARVVLSVRRMEMGGATDGDG